MGTDPEPHDLSGLRHHAERAIPQSYSDRLDLRRRMYALEAETGVVRVRGESPIRLLGESPDGLRKASQGDPEIASGVRLQSFSGSNGPARPARKSSRARDARRPSLSPERANAVSHRRSSDSIASSSHRANSSCSLSDISREALSKASFRSLVTNQNVARFLNREKHPFGRRRPFVERAWDSLFFVILRLRSLTRFAQDDEKKSRFDPFAAGAFIPESSALSTSGYDCRFSPQVPA